MGATDDIASTVLEVMGSARAVRSFTDQPVGEDELERLVWAATRAPSPRNVQPWEFVVVRDAERRRTIGEFIEPRAAEVESVIPGLTTEAKKRMYQGAADLIRSIGTAPALIFVCVWERDYGEGFPAAEIGLTAAHTAAQNIILATTAMGLGTTFTTFHLHMLQQLRELLALPDALRIAVTLPIGHPARRGGPVRRRPVAEVLHWDSFSAHG